MILRLPLRRVLGSVDSAPLCNFLEWDTLHFTAEETEFQASESTKMIALTLVVGAVLLTELKELKVVETQNIRVKMSLVLFA